MGIDLEKARRAKDELKKILQDEIFFAVGISAKRLVLNVRITTDDPNIVKRIKQKIPEKINGIKVDVEIVGKIKPRGGE